MSQKKHLVSEAFFNDPRIKQALDLIKQTVTEHRSKITGLKNPHPELTEKYEKVLKDFSQNRGGDLYYKYIGSGIGNGALVELTDGSTKYDFITGIGVHYFGHSHPDVINAQIMGALSNTTMSGNLQQNQDSQELMQTFITEAQKYGSKLEHIFLTSSGAMAGENALKMAFCKKFPASRILTFKNCFMGRTLALSQITDKALYRKGLPSTLKVDYLSFYDYKDHEGSIKNTLKELNTYFTRYPNDYAAICMELVQGEGGYYVGHTEFFKAIINECKKNNVAIVVDEVQTFARSSKMYCFQHFNLDQDVDIVTVGKNSQVCATLFTTEFKPPVGLISQTFTSANSTIAAANFILKDLINNNYFGENGKINKFHQQFKNGLEKINQKYPDLLEGPYGLGAMIGMTVFKGDNDKSKKYTFKLFDNGVMGFLAGASPSRVRFLMPMGAVTENDVNEVLKIIEKTLLEIN